MTPPIFIFMLTRHDRTVPEFRILAEQAVRAGVRHIGFKDIGVPMSELQALVHDLKAAGATSYLEVVSLDRASELDSACAAMDLDVDNLLGGTHPGDVAPLVKNAPLKYFPFAGRVAGHPSVLSGTIDDIVSSAIHIAGIPGVDGLDLLAYRFAGSVPDLMRSVCRAVPKPIIIAGSIDRRERVEELSVAGAHAFTVGTAVLEGAFPVDVSGLEIQLAAVRAAQHGNRHCAVQKSSQTANSQQFNEERP